jgi:hypothetical protein
VTFLAILAGANLELPDISNGGFRLPQCPPSMCLENHTGYAPSSVAIGEGYTPFSGFIDPMIGTQTDEIGRDRNAMASKKHARFTYMIENPND